MKNNNIKKIALICLIFTFKNMIYAQFNINGQLIQRAEYRHGFGKLIEDTLSPAGFISQRFRLQSEYKTEKFQIFSSIQDIRTWGNTSQVKLSDGYLSLHEGWVNLQIDSLWSIKLGRQELNYDDYRFLGNLDWAMQARSHDFALVKFNKNKHTLHFGGGFNQNSESLSGNVYTQPNQYKTAQMLWYNYKKDKLETSFLFWNNGLQYILYDSTGKNIIDQDLRFTQTFAIPKLKYTISDKTIISGFAYMQTGKDIKNKEVKAYDVSLQVSQVIAANKNKNTKAKLIVGAELISGTNSNNTTNSNNSFSPMYGTNHMHNGYMDYFFVGGRFDNSVGLNDMFVKLRYEKEKKWFCVIEGHSFSSNAGIYKNNAKQESNLGVEIDFSAGYVFNKDVSLQLGYSQMFASNTLKDLQTRNPSNIQNWSYLMLIIRPNSDKKFIGLLN
jgi:hypothetical protein